MKFWAIGYKYQEGFYYNVLTGEDTMAMSEQCLLPSEALAKQLIEDELSTDYAPIEIEIESLSEQGVMCWSRGEFGRWDNSLQCAFDL